jgi:hypothetical protein
VAQPDAEGLPLKDGEPEPLPHGEDEPEATEDAEKVTVPHKECVGDGLFDAHAVPLSERVAQPDTEGLPLTDTEPESLPLGEGGPVGAPEAV